MALPDATWGAFTRSVRTVRGRPLAVWSGGTGPGVLVMHEIPGLHPAVHRFGEDLVAAGFTVWMPELFGEARRAVSPPYVVRSLCGACVSRAFTTWRTGVNSPITEDLRDLSRDLADATGGSVGAVGMCLTGGFALALMVDPWVTAPVLSQPSLPFAVFPWQRHDLGVDAPTLTAIRQRIDAGVCVLGLRYRGDPAVPSARFRRLERELGGGFRSIELPMALGKHSVLAIDRHEGTVQEVLAFFREHAGEAWAS